MQMVESRGKEKNEESRHLKTSENERFYCSLVQG